MFITVYSIVKRKGFCLFRRWEIQIRPDIIHCSGFSSVIVHTVISYKSFELLISNVKCSPHYKWWRKRNSPTENENSLIYSHPRVVKNLYDFISSIEQDRSYSELNSFGFHGLLLCSTEESKSYRFGTTWEWVLGWTVPFNTSLYTCWKLLFIHNHSGLVKSNDQNDKLICSVVLDPVLSDSHLIADCKNVTLCVFPDSLSSGGHIYTMDCLMISVCLIVGWRCFY